MSRGLRKSLPGMLALAIVASATPCARAEAPKLEALFPAGGQVGSTFILDAVGKLDPDTWLWTDAPGVTLSPEGKNRKWKVEIATWARPGLYPILANNKDGASETRWFSIGSLPEIAEKESNGSLENAQVLQQMPVCINGRLEKSEDVDGFSCKLQDGQTLVGYVEAYALGSPIDVMAHVVNEAGERVLTASDARNLDPEIVYKAPKAGRYTVQIAGFNHPPSADVRFVASPSIVYRLHLSNGPTVTQVLPAAVAWNGKTEVELRGYNLDASKTRHTLEAAPLRSLGDTSLAMVPGAIRPIQVLTTEGAVGVEKEPNNTREQATPMALGAMGGVLSDKTDVDRYAVTMKRGDRFQATVWSKQLGLPLDGLLKIEAPDGKQITMQDDQGPVPDPMAQFGANEDGVYQVIVEDLFKRGGEAMGYVLEVVRPKPEFEAKLADAKPVLLEAGKSATLKVTVTRKNGYKEPLMVRVGNLPLGVYAEDTEVPEKGGGAVDIKLQAAANAQAASRQIYVTVWNKAEAPLMQKAQAPLRGETMRGTSLLDFTDMLWLTVKPAAAVDSKGAAAGQAVTGK